MTMPTTTPNHPLPQAANDSAAAPPASRVAISGASGLVGAALTKELVAQGHQVVQLVRQGSSREGVAQSQASWDPRGGSVDTAALEGVDAVVHLAGESIAAGRWSEERRRRIKESRVKGTETLARALTGMAHKPRVLVCASAIGFYGDRGEDLLDEASFAGEGFLADVSQAWEAAAAPAEEAGIRVVNLRFGVILSRDGGALAKMLTPFKLGVGGKVGNGRQWWSWVALEDVVGAIRHAIDAPLLTGPVNVVSPEPARNAEFTKVLGKVLGRPTIFPLPAFMARLMLGQMADELLLASSRVVPTRLEQTNYHFRYPQLEHALRQALGKG